GGARGSWVGQALRRGGGAVRRRPRRRRRRARRPARPERRRQVDARQDLVRARPRVGGLRDGRGRPGGIDRRPQRDRLPRRAVPLPRLGPRRRGPRAPPAPRELRRRRGRAHRAARARRPRRGPHAARRGDVQGHAAAARDRTGDDRAPEAADARRADERARPRRAPRRPRAAGRAAQPRPGGAPELASALRGRARLRPRRHRQPRPDGHRRRAVGPRQAPRGRGRDGGRSAALRGRRARRRAPDRRRPRRRRRAGLRGAGPALDARGRLHRGRLV
ncbi:MAG: Efflux ABC transporter, ATP-binding protein, partial [uncultured Solirubrobacteraceae bacterium]